MAIKRRTIFKRKKQPLVGSIDGFSRQFTPVTMGVVVEYCATRTFCEVKRLEIEERNDFFDNIILK